MIRFQFVLGDGWVSRAIAWFSAGTRGGVSHVDVVMRHGMLLGSRSDSVGGQPPGVHIRDQDYAPWRRRVVISLDSTEAEELAFYRFLNDQLGKPYDKVGILGFVGNRSWHEEDSWFCSELVAAALEEAGVLPKLFVPANKITPNELAVLLTAIGGDIEADIRI